MHYYTDFKVQLFWEGHKNLGHPPYVFEIYLCCFHLIFGEKVMKIFCNIFIFFSFSVLPEYSLDTSKEDGGLGIVLENGSLLFEVALKELHATTKLENPNRMRPTRIGTIIFKVTVP